MKINYNQYLDQILGGWIGKSLGGAVGMRFEGHKDWIDIDHNSIFPEEMPPNDELDLQVLWLKVLEEKGATLTSDDLAKAWSNFCWYPYNEYGTFRRNWSLGIHPPYSGSFDNRFWDTGLGCPARVEIWGYVFPGAPDLAAAFAEKDGVLDHTEQAVGAEKMLAAMGSMAFFVPDVRRLAEMFIHYLPWGTAVDRLVRGAFQACDEGLSLREARERLIALVGHPEACDTPLNVAFVFLGLLYGRNDPEETLLCTLKCGYDTDSTLAIAGALLGQILGASRIPARLWERVGDELVMAIQYKRPEMTLSALARDTARMGVILAREMKTGTTIEDAPDVAPLPASSRRPRNSLRVDYEGLPAAAPGDNVQVTVSVEGPISPAGAHLTIEAPTWWNVEPESAMVNDLKRKATFTLHAHENADPWPMQNIFKVRLLGGQESTEYGFGVAGASLWKFLGVYFDSVPPGGSNIGWARRFQHHFVSLDRDYLPEPSLDVEGLYHRWSKLWGKPAMLAAYEQTLDVSQMVGLQGPYCVYLARIVFVSEEREAYLVVGNNGPYRIYLNGAKVADVDEDVWWTPFNNIHRVRLQAGENKILVKLVKKGEKLDFSFGIRKTEQEHYPADESLPWHHNYCDWYVDLADRNPLA